MGLLDNILANPEATNALAAGLLQGNFAGGLLGMDQVRASQRKEQMAREELAMKKGLLDAQIANYQSEAETRKLKGIQDARMQGWIGSLFGEGGVAGAPSGASPASSLGAGAIGGQAGSLIQQAEALGIPRSAIQTDMIFNGGKGIAQMIYEKGAPDIQVSNGFAYNKNALGPGFMPSLSTSQDGKTSMVRIGPDGLPIVSAPAGAMSTFAGYRNIDESAKAAFDPTTITPQGENPQLTTRLNAVTNPAVQGRMTSGKGELEAGRQMILQQELTKATQALNTAIGVGDQSAAARAQADIAALNREMGRGRPSVGLPLQSEEEKARALSGVKGDAERNSELVKQTSQSKDTLSQINRARELLKSGPTSSGIGAAVDKAAGWVGKSFDSTDKASALDALSGWLTSNIPRMEGPQSNFDVENYKTMAGRVGDRTLPVSQRLAALNELEAIQAKYSKFTGGATGNWEANGKASSMSGGGWSAKRIN